MNQELSVVDIQAMVDRSRFHQQFQPEILNVDHAKLQLTIKFAMCDAFERQPGTNQWHGGAISALIDTAGCYALALQTMEPLPTINFRTDYLRPAIGTDLTATAFVRKAGRSVGVVDVDVNDDAGQLIALGRACYSVQA